METNANQKVSCVVKFAYEAAEADELSLRPGDVLRDVERLAGGWWRGELRGRRGMFPDNFVSVLDHANSRSAGVQGRCRAVFSYQPANPDELPLCVGDVLDVLGEVEEGWWQGRRQGRVGVFPSNFVVMLDAPAPPADPAPAPAPALPPKPVKEQCRVIFPYVAVNEDELTLREGDVLTLVSRDAPDRGWWRGELHGRVGLFPDNFVQLLPPVAAEVEEKKPERPPAKSATNSIYPILNKYSEKTASVKELSTSKISVHKENTTSKESSTLSAVTLSNRTETEKVVHNETLNDSFEQIKKPPVPLKKSPTPASGVTSLFSGLKSKMLSSTDKDKSDKLDKSDKSAAAAASAAIVGSGSDWDRLDGAALVKPASPSTNTFDHVERNSILNDPRASRVKAPRRRPPSQALRDDAPLGLSNGHDAEKPPEKAERTERAAERTERVERTERTERTERAEEIKPRAREWEKHKAPWMEELKLNQAKKTSLGADGKPRPDLALGSKATSGSTDRILDCGLEEKRSTHSMEMSKSTSSISSRMSIMESFEETKVRHSLDSKKEATAAPRDAELIGKPVQSPTAAGRTILSMLDEIKKPQAPPPPQPAPLSPASALPPPASAPPPPVSAPPPPVSAPPPPVSAPPPPASAPPDKSPAAKVDKPVVTPERHAELGTVRMSSSIFETRGTLERIDRSEERVSSTSNCAAPPAPSAGAATLERRADHADNYDALIAQLNNRISNLEKLIEVQNSMFSASIEELQSKLVREAERRAALQAELDKLAHCVTQV